MAQQNYQDTLGLESADTIIKNGHIATLNQHQPFVSAIAIKNGRILAVGSDEEVMARQSATTQVIDAGGRTIIPGLNDSHIH